MSTTKHRRRLVAPIALTAAAAATLSIVASGAWFTDSDTVGSNTFTTGDVDIAANPTTTAFNVSGMAPGDTAYSEITVHNPGSLAMRYAVTSAHTGDASLTGALMREIKTAATCDDTGWAATTSTVVAPSTPMTTTAVFGSPSTGNQTGDRALAANATEKLCVRVTLPESATNTVAGKNTSVTFTFAAEQTKNN